MARPRPPKTDRLEVARKTPLWRNPATVLLVILIVGASLRLVNLRQSPPGLNQDEAANAWNTRCMLETGRDQTGARWPIFYSRFLGENRNTLYLYWALPFQAIGGLNIWTTRLPSAVGGVLTLPLIYWVAARMFGRTTGLVAAALLALNPWHIQQSRWGHEAAIVPLLTAISVAAILWANLPFDDAADRRPRPLLAALAGAAVGICCYGYFAIRAFLPLFIAAAVVVSWRAWWTALKSRTGAIAIAAFMLGLSATFGPLAFKHLTDPVMGKRLADTRVWKATDPFLAKASKVLARYPGHFGPDFLFIHGDRFEIQSPPGSGLFHAYMLPLMLLGLVFVLTRLRTSRADRILLVWLILYPVGDCLSSHLSLHALRSLPGLCGLVLLGAIGAVESGRWLAARSLPVAWATGTLLAMCVLFLNVRFVDRFFGEFNRRPLIYHTFQADLVEACEWIRPRVDRADAVVCTVQDLNMPYMITLVTLGHEPRQWFSEEKDFQTVGAWDYCKRYGKFWFPYDDTVRRFLDGLTRNGRTDNVLFIARPGEIKGLGNPAHRVVRPDGEEVLWIFDVRL